MAATPAAAEDPFLDMLNKRGNDREAILREFDNIPPITVTPPPDAPAAQPPGDDAAGRAPAPQFRIVSPRPAENGQIIAAPTAVALVLPTDAGGRAAAFAARFYEGCARGLSAAGAGAAQIHLYATDGSVPSAVAAYQQAVKDGAPLIIGPMRKQSVEALQQAHPDAPTPTLLLQPGRDGGGGYYVLSINVGAEIAELAATLHNGDEKILLVSDNSPTSKRQAAAFAGTWGRLNGAPPPRFYVYDKEKDWSRLFEQLKDDSVKKAEQSEKSKQKDGDKTSAQTALFAAGDGAFVRNVRNFSPQGNPVFASSIFYTGEEGAAAMFLENLRIMEMPWFLADENELRDLETPLARSRPVLQQRFYALGADACRIATQTPFWFDGWRFAGISGDLELRDKTFIRRGLLARYESGLLRKMSP